MLEAGYNTSILFLTTSGVSNDRSLFAAGCRIWSELRPLDRRARLEICALARQMNAETYRMLMLVREFDDRFGFAKWGLRSCAEWLAWRCGLSLSAAREKVRTAHALRALPAISAAFADGGCRIRRCERSRASRGRTTRTVARVRARRDRGASRGALPADAQRRAGVVDAARRLGAAFAHAVSRSRARHACGSPSSCRKRKANSSARARQRGRRGEVASGVEFATDRERASAARRTAGGRSRPMRSSRS